MDVPTVHPDELALFAVEMLGRGGVGEGHLLAEGEACQRAIANIWERVGNILPIVRNICAAVRVSYCDYWGGIKHMASLHAHS